MKSLKAAISIIFLLLPLAGLSEEELQESQKTTRPAYIPKVAVTDITYKKELSRKINFVGTSENSTVKAKGTISERESNSPYHNSYSRNQTLGDRDVKSNTEVVEGSKDIFSIRVGELRSITGDIKAEMLKSGAFRLVQGKPFTASRESEEIYDVIKRIKEGYYPGAEYVLFGTLIEIQANDETIPIQGTDSLNSRVSLELAAEFNLINTKSLEVMSAFSASGEGSDIKLIKPGSTIKPSRVKATREVSKSLAEDVIGQLMEQFPQQQELVNESTKRNKSKK